MSIGSKVPKLDRWAIKSDIEVFPMDINNNNNNIHLYSEIPLLICSSALYNSIKVGVCYVCMCMYAYVCVCMLVRYVYALKLI